MKITLLFKWFKYVDCNKNYEKEFDANSAQRFGNTSKFCDRDINKFCLLPKGVYPYEYMDSWQRFYETSLSNKKKIYSDLTIADITDAD